MNDYSRLLPIWPGNLRQWDWQDKANCRGSDIATWFEFTHLPQGRGGAQARAEDLNARFCHDCPVIDQCREWAEDDKYFYGVAAGIAYSEESGRKRQPKGTSKYARDYSKRKPKPD